MEEETSLTDEIVQGGFWAGFATLLNRIGAFIFSIILARFLFPENFGLYSLAMSLATIFTTFADFGLNSTLIRYFSSSMKNKSKSAKYFQYIFKLKFFISLFASLSLLFLAYPISFFIYKKPELFMPLIVSSLFIFTFLFSDFFSSFFYAIKKINYIAIKEILSQIIRLIITILVFILLLSSYHVLGVLFGMILNNLIMILFLLIWINKLTPYIFKTSKSKEEEKIDKKRVFKYVGWITLAYISGIFFTTTDIVMLGFFVSLSYIGFYKVATSLIIGAVSLFTHLGFVILPSFTILKKNRLEQAFNKVLRITLILSIPTAFGILALGKYFIKFLFGDAYMLSRFPLYYLSFLLLFWVSITIIVAVFFSHEKPKYVAIVTITVLLLNIILNYILISALIRISESLAIQGAAIATTISFFFYFLVISALLKKKFNIGIIKTNVFKPIIAGLIMFLFLYAANSYLFRNITLSLGIIEIFFGAAIYFLALFLIKGISIEDFQLLKRMPFLNKLNKLNHNKI